MTARPVFVLDSVIRMVKPEPALPLPMPVVDWLDVCHGQRGKEFLFVDYSPSRSPSRWTYAENKRPYVVYTRQWHKLGASASLAGALKIAKREA